MTDRLSNADVTRRTFLQAASLTAVAAASGCATSTAGQTGHKPTRRAARNVIFMCADGMSIGTLTLADLVLKEQHGRRAAWLELLEIAGTRRALATTYSADSWVTDSAAGGCAWSIGQHVNNGTINLTPDGQMLSPIHVRAKARGLSTGLVTTTTVTHATPASFVANVPDRNLEIAIAEQILQRGIDVCFGGGARFFSDPLLAAHPQVSVHKALPDLSTASAGSRHLGLFTDSHMPYVLDRDGTIPSLGAMTTTALGHLARNPDGFLLQVEGGRVDHAAHANDAAALVAEQIDYDDALRAAMEFTLGRDDTLLITTSDHGNANPGLTAYASKDGGWIERLTGANSSMEPVWPKLAEAAENNTLGELIAHTTGGYQMSQEDTAYLRSGLLDSIRTDPYLVRSQNRASLLGSMLSNYHSVGFMSPHHTSDMVEVAAIGPGAELIEPVIDNIDLHSVMQRVLHLDDAAPMA
ncbi:MAG: alkaline phosphatase [Phycisphaerales bacterium]|jgi:alkaline phosphatase